MSDLASISRLLHVIYDARSSNDDRKTATLELEHIREQPEALVVGLTLAQDRHRPPAARYYGLSVLEHGIRYRWDTCTEDQTTQIRQWLLELAHDVDGEEPLFVRNKIAQLLYEVTERSWGSSFHDFDQQLLDLWHRGLPHKQIVVATLEILSDKVFGKDDTASGLRGAELGKLCVDLFMPLLPVTNGHSSHDQRSAEGWLIRLLQFYTQSLHSDEDSPMFRETFLMTMSLLRSTMSWLLLKALMATDCIPVLCHCLSLDDAQINTTTLEVLHALYHRVNYSREEVEKLVCPLLQTDGIDLLRRKYQRLSVDIDDLNESKYIALKRLSEVVCSIGMFFEHSPWLLETPQSCNFSAFVELLVLVLNHPSLTVSIPVIYLWTKLLNIREVRYSSEFTNVMGSLLELCRSRLIRYEMLPADSSDAVLQFLNEDFDTTPEKHAFVGNYRRFCVSIIERIVRRSPFEALSYILKQSADLLRSLVAQGYPGSRTSFSTDSQEQLVVEAQCTVTHTAIKAYLHWSIGKNMQDEPLLSDNNRLHDSLEKWCMTSLSECTQDPIIQKRILSLVVDTATTCLPSTSQTGLSICESILSSPVVSGLGSDPYAEALKDLQLSQARELQKLAICFADLFFPAYGAIRDKVYVRLDKSGVEQRIRLDHQAFLLAVVQRSSIPTENERKARLQEMVDPVVEQWQDPRLQESLNEMSSFLSLLNLQDFPGYFRKRNAHKVNDWSSIPLDTEGLAMRDAIQKRVEDLPLQATRVLLSISTSGNTKSEHLFNDHLDSLRPLVPLVLPRLLQMLGLAHAFSSPERWEGYPPEMRDIINHITTDRVWQNGISTESRDSFFQRIKESRETLEGLASAVRGSVRGVREFSMWILHSFTHYGTSFYGLHEFPELLARALYENAHCLNPHQISALLNLSTTLVDRCPKQHRQSFLPPLLVPLFKFLDSKITEEWQLINRRTEGEEATGDLESEMKSESVVRNLTHSAVMLASNLLSFSAKGPEQTPNEELSVRALILTTPNVLEPLMLFATHVLRMNDSRSCAVIARVLRSLIPEFQHEDSSPSPTTGATIDASVAASLREFFSTEVLRASITSIHEPYFAELQKDLAALVGSIIHLYSMRTETPRQVLQSLPGISEDRVSTQFEQIRKASNERSQRGAVLSLLERVRGTSIYEQGKIPKSTGHRRSALEEQIMDEMAVDHCTNSMASLRAGRPESPDLGGVADLLG